MTSEKYTIKKIRTSDLQNKGFLGLLLKIIGPLFDLILGIGKVNSIQKKIGGKGFNKEKYIDELLKLLKVQYNIPKENLKRIPKRGPLIIVSNHPFGGLEGVILAKILSAYRPDVKIMANMALKVFPEIRDFFIFTNPLITNNPKNVKSINQCRDHLKNNGLLLLFPAGKVAYYRKEYKRVTDGDWNRIAAHLSTQLNVPILPMFVSGHNSNLFLFMGRIYYRFKLLMLIREFLKRKKETVEIRTAFPLLSAQLQKKGSAREITNFLRVCSYSLDPKSGDYNKKIIKKTINWSEMPPLAGRVDKNLMLDEIKGLPEVQHLVDYKDFSIYYGYYKQLENVVTEISILREKTFRELNEGSGLPRDTDKFDETYTHLFIWDNKNEEIIGAYRMGQTDLIPERYLLHMFDFSKEFFDLTTPALEMGRSFIVKEHQHRFYGLFLLWRGIGEFAVRNPRYKRLYGTVSLSNVFDIRSISLMNKILTIENSYAKTDQTLTQEMHSEVYDYMNKSPINYKELSYMVRSIEPDGKDLPIILKQYWKLGAQFYLTAIDNSFLNTAGMLLVVNLPDVPKTTLKMYMEDGMGNYLNDK